MEDINHELAILSRCVLKADIYSFENNYYQALTRIDTTFEEKHLLRNRSSQLLSSSLNYTAGKVASLDLDQLLLKKNQNQGKQCNGLLRSAL